MNQLEIAANGVTAVSILVAARNSVHTWWTGIIGCTLFAALFWEARLYADVVLQGFFVATSLYGWWHWVRGGSTGREAAVRRTSSFLLVLLGVCAVLAALTYGALLHRFTDAYAPFADSAVLSFSVLAQFLLMRRLVETWAVWLAVNTIAVPLYASRGLEITALLYAVYWVNAVRGWSYWHKLAVA